MPSFFRPALVILTLLLSSPVVLGAPVPVRYLEGLVHGFLTLSSLDGTLLATGDLIQVATADRVRSRVVFHFKDGSLHDETAEFSQRKEFKLLSDHVVQKGKSFPQAIDMTLNAATGNVTVQYTEKDGDRKVESEQLDVPADLANGMISTLLKNVRPGATPKSISYVAATPKPRLVELEISRAGQTAFTTAGRTLRATHYVLKVDIGGIEGFLAPVVGKQPPDSHVWILEGDAPAFIRAEQPLYSGGPVWRIDLAKPDFPRPVH